MGWAMEEFRGIDLGDQRLDRRAVLLAERLAEKPLASIPGACNGWAETQAAYRFFGQEEMDWRDLLAPHTGCTLERMRPHRVVLCLQDTTELDFNGQAIAGLGPLSYEAQRGMYVHPTYAVSAAREPLGVLDAWMWTREPKDAEGQRGGLLESRRWLEGYERVAEWSAELPGTRLVYVADREADILDLLQRARDLGNPADWLVRSQHNRALPEGAKLWSTVTAGEPLGEIRFTLPGRKGRKARAVRQQVWAQSVTLGSGANDRVVATCLVAKEVDAPLGVEPIEWRLLTNRAATTLAQAVELIDWYRARWEIELLFHVFKNGCRVEALQLSTVARIERALTLYLNRSLADRPPDALGPDVSRSGGGPAVRTRGMGSRLRTKQEEAAPRSTPVERGDSTDRAAWRISRSQGRWRTRRQDPLARIAAGHGFCPRPTLRTGASDRMSCV